jgi:hypothetical protein
LKPCTHTFSPIVISKCLRIRALFTSMIHVEFTSRMQIAAELVNCDLKVAKPLQLGLENSCTKTWQCRERIYFYI